MCGAASNRTQSPTLMRPESGLANPATQSRTVVFAGSGWAEQDREPGRGLKVNF